MDEDKVKLIKRKVAIFFGYNGTEYHGLQKNEGVKTVESVLEKALYQSNFILETNYGDLKKSGWGRGSRTDKGVHASVNTICVKLNFDKKYILPFKNEKDVTAYKLNTLSIIDRINEELLELNEEIRVFDIKIVTKKFDVKKYASSRNYEYILPEYILKKENNDINIDELITKINDITSNYNGTHNFHNYTVKGKPQDKSMNRYIMSFKAEKLESNLLKKNNYIIFKIHGQSFMYHQIRKMIACIITIIQEDLTKEYILNTYSYNLIKILLAPSEGLLLDRINFKSYNAKDDINEKLEFDEEAEKRISNFKYNTIYKEIIENEEKNEIFKNWLLLNKKHDN